ncbi:MAG: hypothetical protein RL148_2428 [Planctomycetota bacterium]
MREPLPADPIEQAVRILAEHHATGVPPRDLVAAAPSMRDWSPARRAEFSQAVYGAIAMQRRIEFALATASGWSALTADARAAADLLGWRVLAGTLDVAGAATRFARFSPVELPWAELAAVGERIDAVVDPVQRLALRHSLPDWAASELVARQGEAAEAVARALGEPAPRTVRANLLRCKSREDLAARLAAVGVQTRPTRFAPHGLHVDGTVALTELSAFREGWFEQQDEASQLAALAVAPPPRGRVLDACAGSGGKTLALASMMGNKGEILAIDVHAGRLEGLVERCRRTGVSTVRARHVEEETWSEEVEAFARKADRILIDAPCSGMGAWRRRPEGRWLMRETSFPSLQRSQAKLLRRSAALLQPGARLVYATCTLRSAENEEQVRSLLAEDAGLELVRLAEVLGAAVAGPISDPSGTWLSLRPDVHGTDGFFAAILRRKRG